MTSLAHRPWPPRFCRALKQGAREAEWPTDEPLVHSAQPPKAVVQLLAEGVARGGEWRDLAGYGVDYLTVERGAAFTVDSEEHTFASRSHEASVSTSSFLHYALRRVRREPTPLYMGVDIRVVAKHVRTWHFWARNIRILAGWRRAVWDVPQTGHRTEAFS